MSNKCHYLAYGSNLHPRRLLERIPSSRFVDTIELKEHRLHFHKLADDQSGKCNLLTTGANGDLALAAIYEMDVEHKTLLDDFEGPGYRTTTRALSVAGEVKDVFWYTAETEYIDDDLQPYCWYREIVILGAKFHNFPEHYLATLAAVEFIDDPNDERRTRHGRLIDRIQRHN